MKGYDVTEQPLTKAEAKFMREYISQTDKHRVLDLARYVPGGEPPSPNERQGRNATDIETMADLARTVS